MLLTCMWLQLRSADSPDGSWSAELRDGESLVMADVASTGSIDHIIEEVDTDKTPYPIGYIGKSSEVSWIQRVAQQLASEARSRSPQPPGGGMCLDPLFVELSD